MSKISAEHLKRHAVVYVRQSTLDQVQHNLESQRRQYALADRARVLGWQEVTVIDDDLGRSGGGGFIVRALSGSWRSFARVPLAWCSASRLLAWRATAATGIRCSSSVAWSMRSSSTRTASTMHDRQTTGCSWAHRRRPELLRLARTM